LTSPRRTTTPSLTRPHSPQIKARVAPEIDVPVVEPDAPDAEDEDAVVNVMPAKANADLKRDVERKLEKLERKTQRAMIELTREEDARRMAEQPHK
jgi:coiled-coil domain-containing protein 12